MNRLVKFLGVFLITMQGIWADSPRPPQDYTMERYNEFQVVFEGKPIAIKDYGEQYQIVVFEVNKAYRGALEGERLEVYTPAIHCSNPNVREREIIQFEMQESYLVFAYQENTFILTHRSAGTALISSFEYREREQLKTRELYKQRKPDNRVMPDRIRKILEKVEPRQTIHLTPYELVRRADASKNEYAQYRNLEGIVIAEGRLQDGVPVGEWGYYNSKGSLRAKGCYEHGRKDGEWTEYPFVHYLGPEDKTYMWKRKYTKGIEIEFAGYDKGKLNEKTVFNFSHSNLNIECTKFHTRLFGGRKCNLERITMIEYYSNGQKKIENIRSVYKEFFNEIESTEYFGSGKIEKKGLYKVNSGDGTWHKNGLWITYNKNGTIANKQHYNSN